MRKEDFISYFIINVPVFLFIITSIVFLFLTLSLNKFFFLFGVWWSLSGAIVLFIDFLKNKRKKFFRLLILFQKGEDLKKLKNNLKQTLCGFFLLLALKYRLSKKPII